MTCTNGPHDGRQMDVPDDAVRLEFLDGAEYLVDAATETATFKP